MDLKGAEIRNILDLCRDMGTSPSDQKPLRVNIPHYQRPYKWDEARITNLIDDFDRNMTSDTSNNEYFVGSVVLVNNSHGNNSRQDVIDGQQRITTVFLLNYIRFLLLRARAEDALNRRTPASIVGTLSQLIECYTKLLGGDAKGGMLAEFKGNLEDEIDELADASPDIADQTWARLLSSYQDCFGLPERVFDDTYGSKYKAALGKFLQGDNLALRYSRSSYNAKLREALSSAVLRADNSTLPRLSIEYAGDDEVVRQYVRAIEYEFQALFDRAVNTGDNPTQAARKLIRYIDAMIDSIKFCVILTGNESDAYTLFEVLNDRAMEVDDLDLIKNLFLRQYCNTSHEGENLIDKTVGEIDTQWGEHVFKPGLSQARAKMISYLGAVYLTADSSIHSNKTERFREVIDTQYFGQQYVTKPYTSECIRRDITIYQMIGVLFDRYKLQAMKKDVDALKAEVSNFSITFRALHLLNALGQDGVMAAIVNLILRTYIDNMEASQRNPLSMENFKEFLDDLKSRSSHQQDAFSTIHRWAFELWKATLLSESYEYPREIARKIISSVHSTANNIESVAITKQEHDAMVSSFNSWISAWRYKKSPVMLKTKILFCELIFSARSEDEERLMFSKISMSINTEKLQLDHLDAQNPTEEYADFYYIPDDPNAQRRDTIDGLGNMMILTSEENNNKGNKPLEDALGYYKVMCPNGHWLIEEIQLDLEYDGNYRTVNAGNKQRRVPTDQFFTMRKEQLRRYFLTILSRDDIDDTEAMICAS